MLDRPRLLDRRDVVYILGQGLVFQGGLYYGSKARSNSQERVKVELTPAQEQGR
jgi:hypothetical protein